MRSSRFSKATVWILVGVVAASVASTATAQSGGATPDRAGPAGDRGTDQIVLRRDGDRAIPFDPVIGTGDASVFRRDGSRAVPFRAQVGPPAAVPTADGFDWGDALIGAAGAYALILLASGAVLVIRGRRPPQRLAQRPT
jgi:uncharacterized iron-regulated membrane protein